MRVKLKPISDQVVVLLGATSGIGLETAFQMVDKGARVAIIGRSQDALNDAMQQVRSYAEAGRMSRSQGGNGHMQIGMIGDESGQYATDVSGTTVSAIEDQVIALEADVTNFDQVKSVADQVVQRFGRIDTWVNLAAVSEYALFEDTTPDEFHRIIEVNLLGQAYGAMAAMPYLKQQGGGALIFVASIEGRIPIPYQSAYNASKHGILGLAETLRQEVNHTGVPISVTTILPASINTPLHEKSRTKIGVEPEPIRPVYDARMVAKSICHAAAHPVRELIVGDAGYMMNFMRRVAPSLTSDYMGATGFRMQRSSEPKSAQAPNNLYQHIEGYEKVQGDYEAAQPVSVMTWFSTHPKARMALYGGLLAGLGGLIGWQVVTMRNKRRSWRYQLPRQARKQARKAYKQASKSYQQASRATVKYLQTAAGAMSNIPVVSSLPVFRKRSFFERMGDTMLGVWAAMTSLSLPFISQRKSVVQRISGRLPNIKLSAPWDGAPRNVGKKAAKMAAQQRNKTMKMVDRRMKKAQKRAEKAMDRVQSRRRDALKAVSRRMPSRSDIQDMVKRGRVVERRKSFIEKMPFGERRETVVEKMPYNK